MKQKKNRWWEYDASDSSKKRKRQRTISLELEHPHAFPHLPMSSLKLDSGRITSGEISHQETKLQATEMEVCVNCIISRGAPPGLGGSEKGLGTEWKRQVFLEGKTPFLHQRDTTGTDLLGEAQLQKGQDSCSNQSWLMHECYIHGCCLN